MKREILSKAGKGHWKGATRKLKKLSRRYGNSHVIPAEVYVQTLEACMQNRLQGARASEPARKILEQMVELGYEISEASGNYCIKNCLGESGPDSRHQGFGGIDTALAMKTALEMSGTSIQLETNEKLAIALAREGSMKESLEILRNVVVDDTDRLETPSLSTFAEIGLVSTKLENAQYADMIPTLLAYAKAAGYDLDAIASTRDGCTLLASGVVAAERQDNVALGLRLLTAARKVERGDEQVARSSPVAQRACMRLHQRAIKRAVVDEQWRLAVKVLTLMLDRSLRPPSWVWRSVVTCCAKSKKSKRATGILQDWVRLYKEGKADKPPLSVFNTCVNACEICNEEELTLTVLDSMRETHDTEGNLITFNIALKRLAKQGNARACEGIIIGMLQSEVEPSVVSYTTAIAACANVDNKSPAIAYEWLKRMRSRLVSPNVLTYNTALAACLDGSLAGGSFASQMASEIMVDAAQQLADKDNKEYDEYTNVVPDATTKMLARQALEQLDKNWEECGIPREEMVYTPLVELADFQVSEATKLLKAGGDDEKAQEDQLLETRRTEVELEFSAASSAHRVAEV